MLESNVMILLASSVTLLIVMLASFVSTKSVKLLLPQISLVLLILFGLKSLNSVELSIGHQSLLFVSIAASLLGIVGYWPKMLKQPAECLAPWLVLLISLATIVINQMFWHSPMLFALPVLLFPLLVIHERQQQYRALQLELGKVQKQLQQKSASLTMDLSMGLPNKLAFCDRVDKWLLINPSHKLNIMVFKFTEFEALNSLIGHGNADLVKTQLITRLKTQLATEDNLLMLSDSLDKICIATLGGVDFAIAINEEASNHATERLVLTIANVINEPLIVNSTAVDVGIDFGVAGFPEQGGVAEDLIEHAYLALNQRRELDSSMYFDPRLEKKLQINRTVIGQLRDDLANNKFELFVQPQVNLHTNEIEGGEVLVRWRRDEKGVLDASKFIELAEQSGVIYQLSLWGLEQMIKKLADLKAAEHDQYLAVNISNRELFQTHFVETVVSLLEKYDVAAKRLVVEIKESAFAVNQIKALKITHMLQQKGVRVALDDFGKDQTAIGCFNSFTPFYVKVDCRGLNLAGKKDKSNTFLNAIIGLAKTMQIKTIAQGIELEGALGQLRDIDCDVGQGFLFSKPFELEGFDIWLEQWNRNKTGQ
jgi:EAL domain-containing protein (putative c-di-GMP-specific phosphodiesterase class I)